MVDDHDANGLGERLAHRMFGVEHFWQRHDFNSMFNASLSKGMIAFVKPLPFFFIATANKEGKCDCSFRGRDYDASGKAYPLLKVLDTRTLIFPDFSGNNFFNSLGNILVNGHIGMLFIDFNLRLRLRINGAAHIVTDCNLYKEEWPTAQRFVQVKVEQAYGNCPSRIPRLKLAPNEGIG